MPASRREGECGGLGSWCVREAKGGALFLALQAQWGYLCSAPQPSSAPPGVPSVGELQVSSLCLAAGVLSLQ